MCRRIIPRPRLCARADSGHLRRHRLAAGLGPRRRDGRARQPDGRGRGPSGDDGRAPAENSGGDATKPDRAAEPGLSGARRRPIDRGGAASPARRDRLRQRRRDRNDRRRDDRRRRQPRRRLHQRRLCRAARCDRDSALAGEHPPDADRGRRRRKPSCGRDRRRNRDLGAGGHDLQPYRRPARKRDPGLAEPGLPDRLARPFPCPPSERR